MRAGAHRLLTMLQLAALDAAHIMLGALIIAALIPAALSILFILSCWSAQDSLNR
jgi:hypothetical protein